MNETNYKNLNNSPSKDIFSSAPDVEAIFHQYYPPGQPLTQMLWNHSRHVRDKALGAAEAVSESRPDMDFINQASLLHDIGIYQTHAPRIHCLGAEPYIRHGLIGRRILEQHGLVRHALVCERHVGAGLSRDDIKTQQLPLPMRDMVPVSLEEVLICYADKFFSKTNGGHELPLKVIVNELGCFGQDKVRLFLKWHEQFQG